MRALQRKCGCGGTCGACNATAPPSVQRVLATAGQPLDLATRTHMESRFDHDFSSVRLHTDPAAHESARDVGARAYTVGNHIAFAAGAGGRELLAHELTHTIQQRGGDASIAPSLEIGPGHSSAEVEADRVAARVTSGRDAGPIGSASTHLARAPQDPTTTETTPAQTPAEEAVEEAPPPQVGKVVKGKPHASCGRKTDTRVAGFDNTTAGPHISAIDVDIRTNAHSPVTLTWANVPAGVTVPQQLNGSPGAGVCKMWRPKVGMQDVDCSDPTWSNTTDSLCTPIGNFTVQGFACQLGGEPKATRVTWFHHKRGIAFHNYDPVPAYPASHGCVRIDEGKADWIYDNAIPNVTSVSVARQAGDPGPKCYKNKKLRDRDGYVAPTPPTTTPQAPGTGGLQPAAEEVDGA